MPISKGQKIGAFVVQDVLSAGGMAEVLRVKADDGHEYALKLNKVNSEETARVVQQALLRETNLLAQFNHKRIVQIYEIPNEGRNRAERKLYYARAAALQEMPQRPWYYVMELLTGGSLAQYLKQVKQLTVGEAANIAAKVAQGLYLMQLRGYNHNDVKSENVMFRSPLQKGGDFDPVLIDFGIACSHENPFPIGRTWHITPPEVIQVHQNGANRDHFQDFPPGSGDTWAVGVLLYQMLSGRLPFDSRQDTEVKKQILKNVPKNLPNTLPSEISSLVMQHCLNSNPYVRISLADLVATLRPLATGVTVQTVRGLF